MAMTSEELVAQGWKQRELPGFIGTAGPLWTRREEAGWAYGFLAGPEHLNPAGLVHGGALVTLVDHAVSTVAWEACGRAPCVTLQLDTHFIGAARESQFIEARAEVTRRAGSTLFMRGLLQVAGETVLSAQAIMKKVQPASA